MNDLANANGMWRIVRLIIQTDQTCLTTSLVAHNKNIATKEKRTSLSIAFIFLMIDLSRKVHTSTMPHMKFQHLCHGKLSGRLLVASLLFTIDEYIASHLFR